MKKIAILLILGISFGANAQLKGLLQNPIRTINLHINKNSTAKIINQPSSAGFKALKTTPLKDKIASVDENSVTIINETENDLVFAIGSTDMMSNEKIEARSVLNLSTLDPWTNIIFRTKDNHAAYSIKSGNCFKIFWNRGLGIWDLQKAKCDKYEKAE